MYYPFFSMFFIIAINLFIHIPLSFSQENGARFPECSRLFNCGDIESVTYPFWGDDRPEYCGVPEYQLSCTEDSTEIEIESVRYSVLDVIEERQVLRIATKVTWQGYCPSQFTNVSLLNNFFSYSGTQNQNITLSYGCPSITQLSTTNQFNCSDTLNYFWVNPMEPIPEQLSRCNNTIVVPVLQTLVESFTSFRSNMEEIVKDGFEVGYYINNTFCPTCRASSGQCGYDSNSYRSTCFCSNGSSYPEGCPTLPPQNSGLNLGWKIAMGAGAGIGGLILIILFFLYCQYHLLPDYVIFWKRKNKSQRLVEEFFKSYGSLAPKRYNYHDIKRITGSFKEKIGEGGYGCVYKGKLVDNRVVAVKLLNKAKGDGQEFINEVASISRTSHVNVVGLLGFCFGGSKRALIYEFMANGSLEKFIFNRNPVESQFHLGWESLYKIAVGVARGLEYLHRGCNTRILHFDIKPHNILLDQHFLPKISDFGLAKLCLENESVISMLDARGTAGYVAPEVFDKNFGGVSHKSDVYSYGKMVLEIVGRRKNIDVGVDRTSEIYFPHWIYKRLEIDEGLILQGVVSIEEEQLVRKMILVALWCIQTNPMNRPAMTKVVEMLEGGVELLHIPPQPNF